MEKETRFVAFSNQKGGVGKSAMTVLLASYIHYTKNKNVLVVDCDYPQHSIFKMRERDKNLVEKNESYKQMLINQFSTINKKAYTILTSTPEEAKETADKFLEESNIEYDVVFFDLPGTVNTVGVFKSLMNMDYIFTPIVSDRMAMQSSLSFATTIQDFVKKRNNIPLKGLFLFWNMIDSRVSKELFNTYNVIMKQLKLNVLETIMPQTNRYSKELSNTGKPFFRCTLFPPNNSILQGSMLDVLSHEISTIIKL